VDIRITAKADSVAEADRLIAEMEEQVRARVKEGLFGTDGDTLESTLRQALRDRGIHVVMVECGLNGALRARVEPSHFPVDEIRVIDAPCDMETLKRSLLDFQQERNADAALGISLVQYPENAELRMVIITPAGTSESVRLYGGERALSTPWAVNNGLEALRRVIS
jgi:hypothetical protein